MKEGEDGDLFDWVSEHVRPTDPETSRAAAQDTQFRAPNNKLKILRVLSHQGPMTPDEVMHVLGADYHQRFSDLANLDHMISDTGTTRPSDRGCSMIVWEINEKGRQKLRQKTGLDIEIT
jgi:hypothetical protein